MMHKLVGEIHFLPELQGAWPKEILTAEAHLSDEDGTGPWSMRAELWSPPNESGKSLSWISFLSPEAPFAGYPLRESFNLTLGSKVVARCIIQVQPQYEIAYRENDFINNPNAPVRDAA